MEICKEIVMAKYIDKDALVAEIERRKDEEVSYDENGGYASWAAHNHFSILDSIQKFLNTLEVKEVDLESLVKDFCYEYDDRKEKWYELCPNDRKLLYNPTWANFAMSIAKHFFELGLKAQKGE